jgi:hypothetical protein
MNVVRNSWRDPRKGASRTITVEIETTRTATSAEFGLMERLTAVVEDYLAGETATTP